MEFERAEWIGEWENFELYFDDPAPAMQLAWQQAEQAVRTQKKNVVSALLFRNGAKRFWQDACYTQTKQSSRRLGGWVITPCGAENDVQIAWYDDAHAPLGTWCYTPDLVLEKGLEGKVNFVLFAPEAPADCPYRYLLTMPPMPARAEKEHGGLLSHLHFQFASRREELVKMNGKLAHAHWYATMCDADATLLQRCNIVRALHKLPVWTELPQERDKTQ